MCSLIGTCRLSHKNWIQVLSKRGKTNGTTNFWLASCCLHTVHCLFSAYPGGTLTGPFPPQGACGLSSLQEIQLNVPSYHNSEVVLNIQQDNVQRTATDPWLNSPTVTIAMATFSFLLINIHIYIAFITTISEYFVIPKNNNAHLYDHCTVSKSDNVRSGGASNMMRWIKLPSVMPADTSCYSTF